MKIRKMTVGLVSLLVVFGFFGRPVRAQEATGSGEAVKVAVEDVYVPNPSSTWFGLQRAFMRVSENIQLWTAGSGEKKVLLEEKFAQRDDKLLDKIDQLPEEAQDNLQSVTEKLEEKQEERIQRMEQRIERIRSKREEQAKKLERNLKRVREQVEENKARRGGEKEDEDEGEAEAGEGRERGQEIREERQEERGRSPRAVPKGEEEEGSEEEGGEMREIKVEDQQVEVKEGAEKGRGKVQGASTGWWGQIRQILGW